MKNKKHIGSTFDEFLEEEGFLEETQFVAAKRIFIYQLEKEMRKQKTMDFQAHRGNIYF